MAENQQPSGQKKDRKDDEQRERGGPGSNPNQNRPDQSQSDEQGRSGSDSNRGSSDPGRQDQRSGE